MTEYELARQWVRAELHAEGYRWYRRKYNRWHTINIARARKLLSKWGLTPAKFLQLQEEAGL